MVGGFKKVTNTFTRVNNHSLHQTGRLVTPLVLYAAATEGAAGEGIDGG